MQVSDEIWSEMQKRVEERVAEENARPAERGGGDKFSWRLHDARGHRDRRLRALARRACSGVGEAATRSTRAVDLAWR